jgi:hypothetical protein
LRDGPFGGLGDEEPNVHVGHRCADGVGKSLLRHVRDGGPRGLIDSRRHCFGGGRPCGFGHDPGCRFGDSSARGLGHGSRHRLRNGATRRDDDRFASRFDGLWSCLSHGFVHGFGHHGGDGRSGRFANEGSSVDVS